MAKSDRQDDYFLDYFNRSGDSELGDGTLEVNDHGFCVWRTHKDKLILINVYGDGRYWDEWAEQKAKNMNKKSILFATKRNPEGFERKYKYKVTGYILERSI